MTETLKDLEKIVTDQSAPITTRKAAAEHLIAATVENVPVPRADDSEVQERMQPQDHSLMTQLGVAIEPIRRAAKESGQSVDGYTLEQSQRYILQQRRSQAVRKVAADSSTHELIRYTACSWLLDKAHSRSHWRLNAYTPQTLLDRFKAGAEAA